MWALRRGLATTRESHTGVASPPRGSRRAWTWCQCQWQWDVMLCNTLRCVVWHILTDVMWLDTGPGGLALVSISATIGDWHATQQLRLCSMPYHDSCHMIWHWGWIGCHSVMPLTWGAAVANTLHWSTGACLFCLTWQRGLHLIFANVSLNIKMFYNWSCLMCHFKAYLE